MNFPTTKKLKALKYKFCFSFYACQKKVVEFTESAPTIYFRKQQAVEKVFLYMSLLNTFQYKQFQNVMNNL